MIMKRTLFFILLLWSVSQALANNLALDVTDTVAVGEPGNSYVFEGYVHNLGSGVMVVQMTRTLNDIPENWSTTLCFGVNCYPPHVSAPDPVAVNPGDSLFFDIVFNTDELPADGRATLVFEDMVTGEKDSVTFTVQTRVMPAFSFQFEDTLVVTTPGESFTFETYIHNLTDSIMVFLVARLNNDIPSDWSTTLCFGVSCYPPGVSDVSGTILPGDSVFFDIVFSTSSQPDTGRVLLEFLDMMSGQSVRQWLVVITEKMPAPFSVHIKDTLVTGNPGEELVGEGVIYNVSDTTQTVFIVRTSNQLPEGWSSSLCFENCYAPEVDTIYADLNQGDSLEFSIHFLTNDQPASASATLCIFTEGSQDTVKQTFYAETQSTGFARFNTLNPQQFKVLGNYPNPFNNATTIEFNLPAKTELVTLKIFSISGEVVFNKEIKGLSQGVNRVRFSAQNLSSGLYIYKIQARSLGGSIEQGSGKFLLIK